MAHRSTAHAARPAICTIVVMPISSPFIHSMGSPVLMPAPAMATHTTRPMPTTSIQSTEPPRKAMMCSRAALLSRREGMGPSIEPSVG